MRLFRGLWGRLRSLDRRTWAYQVRNPPVVPVGDWVSDEEARRALGGRPSNVGRRVDRVRAGVLGGRLQRARSPDGQLGILRRSLVRELQWRETATAWQRFVRG